MPEAPLVPVVLENGNTSWVAAGSEADQLLPRATDATAVSSVNETLQVSLAPGASGEPINADAVPADEKPGEKPGEKPSGPPVVTQPGAPGNQPGEKPGTPKPTNKPQEG